MRCNPSLTDFSEHSAVDLNGYGAHVSFCLPFIFYLFLQTFKNVENVRADGEQNHTCFIALANIYLLDVIFMTHTDPMMDSRQCCFRIITVQSLFSRSV